MKVAQTGDGEKGTNVSWDPETESTELGKHGCGGGGSLLQCPAAG